MKTLDEVSIIANGLANKVEPELIPSIQLLVDEISERELVMLQLAMRPQTVYAVSVAPQHKDLLH